MHTYTHTYTHARSFSGADLHTLCRTWAMAPMRRLLVHTSTDTPTHAHTYTHLHTQPHTHTHPPTHTRTKADSDPSRLAALQQQTQQCLTLTNDDLGVALGSTQPSVCDSVASVPSVTVQTPTTPSLGLEGELGRV